MKLTNGIHDEEKCIYPSPTTTHFIACIVVSRDPLEEKKQSENKTNHVGLFPAERFVFTCLSEEMISMPTCDVSQIRKKTEVLVKCFSETCSRVQDILLPVKQEERSYRDNTHLTRVYLIVFSTFTKLILICSVHSPYKT